MGSVLPLLFRLFSAVLFLGLSGMALAYDANVSKVEVTGRAAISDDQTRTARRYALEDAFYLAALKAGADISGTTITSKGVLIRDVVKLETQRQLVDYNIVGETNTGTHYEVKLQAFFAKKISQSCPKPKYPSIKVMAPHIKLSSSVDINHFPIAGFVSSTIIDPIVKTYPGHISKSPNEMSESISSEGTKFPLFDYKNLQTGGLRKGHVNEDLILNVFVHSYVNNKELQSHVKVSLLSRTGSYPGLELEELFTSQLPAKFPIRSLSVLWPKVLKIEPEKMFNLVNRLENHLRIIACAPLEAKTVFSSGQLKLGIGSASGIKIGTLAYVASGNESWTLLEVIDVTQTSATLKPINELSNPKTLANQTVRFIEGTL